MANLPHNWSFDKRRKDWMFNKQPTGFSPYVRMYPPGLPSDLRVFDISKETRILLDEQGEVLTHPKIVEKRPNLRRVKTKKNPLHVIANEMVRVWGMSVLRVRGYLLPWVVKTTKRGRDITWRNPTPEDIARIPFGLKGKTCRPNAVSTMKSHWQRTPDKKFKEFLDGNIDWVAIQAYSRQYGRENGRVSRMQPILFPSHDGKRLATGEYSNPIDCMHVSTCAECRRKPRRFHNKLRDEYSMFCSKTEYLATAPDGMKTMMKCNQSLETHVFFKTHEEAINHWNKKQKELRR